ncbi:guanine nucleotide exchange factor [Mycotypha africana]|uniref:guanine nucleotide exchange factor n=1 Tax=Mycotypha africana TaxID=64632 RepID=UPI0023010A3D|nr:guanine nucleotide exchange factor [Mycotypha africana]KAI8971647.1 guanine nucleotide exchange factor [Mycotypha africana]
MSTLLRIAGLHKDVESKDTVTTREALKCIANSIYLKADIKIFLEREQVHSICRSILQTREHLSQEAQFLLCRILFFLTIDRADLVRDLVQSDIAISLEKVLTQNVAQIANEISRKQINRNTPINAYTVTSEALKLLFNILLTGAKAEECNEDYAKIFKGSLGSIFRLLTQVPFPEPQPLIPPHSQAIHSLMQFPYNIVAEKWSAQNEWAAGCYDMKEDKKDLSYLTEKLAGAFNCSIRSLIPSGLPDEDGNKQVDATLAPLILVFVSFADNNNKLKAGLSKHLLPSDK